MNQYQTPEFTASLTKHFERNDADALWNGDGNGVPGLRTLFAAKPALQARLNAHVIARTGYPSLPALKHGEHEAKFDTFKQVMMALLRHEVFGENPNSKGKRWHDDLLGALPVGQATTPEAEVETKPTPTPKPAPVKAKVVEAPPQNPIKMPVLDEILKTWGGVTKLRNGEEYIKIENGAYMPLTIEHIGKGPRGMDMISVCHYGKQNGDMMRDPEMTFERNGQDYKADWYPLTFRNDYAGVCQEAEDGAVWNEDGKAHVNPKLCRELAEFAEMWDKNIGEQGFLDALKQVNTPVEPKSEPVAQPPVEPPKPDPVAVPTPPPVEPDVEVLLRRLLAKPVDTSAIEARLSALERASVTSQSEEVAKLKQRIDDLEKQFAAVSKMAWDCVGREQRMIDKIFDGKWTIQPAE